MSEVVPTTGVVAPSARGATDLDSFEAGVSGLLQQFGVPTDKLFVPVAERAAMVNNVPGVLAELDQPVRDRSFYISKMVAAATVGLFDAALNYLWDELISELRARVAGFDLKYFYDIAAGNNTDLRQTLKSEDDLPKVDDAHLLRATLEIGLLDDVGYHKLDHIRYMRNHASAAHPNQNTLSGLELVAHLQTCIREVINKPQDTVTANTGRLLGNIKKAGLDEAAINHAAAFFDQLPGDRADTLADGLFGLYTAPDRTPVVADNVRVLWPKLWPFVSESKRSNYGLRHARAGANAEIDFVAAARELIDLVDGAAYLTPEVRAVEMSDALDMLDSAHHGYDNFYNEPAPARLVRNLAGEHGDVPSSVRDRYIRTIVDCYLGNGYGVSAGATPMYEEMLSMFTPGDAGVALRLFTEPIYSSLLATRTGRIQWENLLEILEPKLTSTTDRSLMKGIREFNGKPDQLRLDTEIRRLAGISLD